MVLACQNCGAKYNVADYKPEQQYSCKKCKVALAPAKGKGTSGRRKAPSGSGPQPAAAAKIKPEISESQIVAREDVLGQTSTVTDEQQIELDIPKGWTDKLCDTTVGGYKILRKLGQGGMGMIYKAEQLSLNRIVALKMLNHRLASDESFLKRFINEAKFVAKLNHPNLIQIFDVGEDEGRYYFSMEYVEGECVGDILDRMKVIAPIKALDLITQVTRALAQAHEHKIVHRDIKPDNIMLTRQGVAKLADLGIAKTDDLEQDQTEAGMQMGTARYISPEQANDASKVDIRADIYSLGATFFHMVTGRTAIVGKTLPVVLMKLASEPTPSATEHNPDVPWAMSALIKKMMAKDPEERFQDPIELVEALEELKDELKSGKRKKSKKVALAERAMIKIEAPAEIGDLGLELADAPPPPAPALPIDLGLADHVLPDETPLGRRAPSSAEMQRLKDSRTGVADRLFSSAQNKAPAPPPPSRTKLYAGAVALALVAVVGLWSVLGGGQGKPSSENQKTKIAKQPKKEPASKPKKKKLSEKEQLEQQAKAEWERLGRMEPAGLSDSELATLAERLAALQQSYPGTRILPRARQHAAKVHKEQEVRQWRAIEQQVDPLAEKKEYAKALAVLERMGAQVGPRHSQKSKLQGKRTGLQRASTQETTGLLNQAQQLERKGDLRGALELLARARPRQTAENQQKLQQREKELGEKRRQQLTELQVKLYEPYWVRLVPLLTSQDYAGAIAAAEKELTGELAEIIARDDELADLRALGSAWRNLDAGLQALVGKETQLQFVGESKPSAVRITRINPKRQQFTLKASLKRYTNLHQHSLIQLCGEPIDPRQPLGRLRLSLLLATIDRPEDAQALLAQSRQEPAFARFELRLFCWALSLARARMKLQPPKRNKEPFWVESLKLLHRIEQAHAGSPYLAVTAKERQKWAGRVRAGLPAQVLLKLARSLAGRAPAEAALHCKMLIAFYGRSQQAKQAGKLLESIGQK